MDNQTLKYMEDRVKLGNTLKREIETCDKFIDALQEDSSTINLSINYSNGGMSTNGSWYTSKEDGILGFTHYGRDAVIDSIKKRKMELEEIYLKL